MAAVSGNIVKSATLSTTVVDTVTLTCRPRWVRVTNRDATNTISFTVSVDGVTPADPTAFGTDCYVALPLTQSPEITTGPLGAESSAVVKIIGSGGGYTVTAVV